MKLFEIPMLVTSLFGLCLLSGLDAPSVYADFMFGEPVNLGSVVNGPSSSEQMSCISHDGLEMYISWGTPEVDWEICVSRRATTHSDWGPLENLGPVVNTPYEESCACISADGLTLYFNSNRPGGYGSYDIYVTTRATKNDPWGPPVNVGPPVNGSASDATPWITTDGLELYFGSMRSGGYGSSDIYVARRATESDPWGVPVNLGPTVNSAYDDYFPSLSPDGLLLFFSDVIGQAPRPGGYGDSDMWLSMRATTQDSWGAPVNLGPPVNGPYIEHAPRVSPDGLTLYFSSRERPGGYGRWDIWQAPVLPVVDFYADWSVNMKDFSKLAQYWGQDEPSVDIGPMPWGDGAVDMQDLAVLLEYWLSWY